MKKSGITLEQKAKILRNDRKIKKIERAFLKAIKSDLAWFYKKAAKYYASGLFFSQQLTAEHSKMIAKTLENYYTKVFQISVPYTTEQFKNDVINIEKKEIALWQFLLQRYLTKNLLIKATSIARNSEKRVKKIITDAVNNGIAPDQTKKDISSLARVSLARAALIARTEAFAAMNYSQIETARTYADRYGVTKLKKWVAITDNRTRETHLEMNDEQAIPIDDKFYVGGFECDAPHDDSLPAEEVINCRCNLVFENE